MAISTSVIRELMGDGELSINPILDKQEQFGPAKVDLRLDNVFYRMKAEKKTHHDSINTYGDLYQSLRIPYQNSNDKNKDNKDDASFVIHPGEFALARTFEYLHLPDDLLGRLGGRSGLARQGIVIHATASVIDPGYMGYITLEITNFGNVPIRLYPLQPVASVTFERIEGDVESYSGKIIGSGDPFPTEPDISPVLRETIFD